MGDVSTVEVDVFMVYLGLMVIRKTLLLPQFTSLKDVCVGQDTVL